MALMKSPLGWLLFLSLPASAAPPPAVSTATAESLLESALPELRASRADLGVRPERWDTRFKLDSVEALLNDPLAVPGQAEAWRQGLQASTGSAGLFKLASNVLGVAEAPTASSQTVRWPEDPGLSPGPREGIEGIIAAIAQAGPALGRAVDSLSPEERRRALEETRPFLFNEIGRRTDPSAFDAAARFDQVSLFAAAATVTRAVDAALPKLAAARGLQLPRRRFHFPFGDVLISGAGEDRYAAQDLDGVALLVDLGGANRYDAAPAAAGPGEIRVVIDLGSDVVVDAPQAPSGAGSGIFGVGLLYLPEPTGEKRINAGNVSLGAGLFGVGGFFAAGSTATLEGGRFTQGAAAFGAGLFQCESSSASYSARFAGQGFGFTRGAGLFVHRGDGARVACGLSDPDPHEDLAFNSFCQGVGYGPRAFAAGGVGLALAAGSRLDLRSGYFAQGAGYWHGFGALFVAGDDNRLQARRYDQGSGIHTAAGVLRLDGLRDRTVNWGVGPAYGWDWGVGFFEAAGDDGLFAADWAAGHGDFNGRALALIRGDRNGLVLPDFGSGGWKRDAPSYGLALVIGADDRYRWTGGTVAFGGSLSLAVDPWGRLDGPFLPDPDLNAPKPLWPTPDRAAAAAKDRETLGKRLNAAQALPEAERLAQWLSIASAQALDAAAPAQAVRRLAALPASEVPGLIRLVSSDQFDEFVWLRPLAPSYGKAATAEVASELPAARGTRKAMLLSLLRCARAEEAGAMIEALADPDWRVRREASTGLGLLLGRERGEEPGRLGFIEQARDFCLAGKPLSPGSPAEQEALRRMGVKRLADFLGALALLPDLSEEDRLSMIERSPGPVESMNAAALRELVRILLKKPEACQDSLGVELKSAAAIEPKAREALLKAIGDSDPEVAQAALISLAQLGRAADSGRIAAFLDHPRALLREAAAAALGKLGADAEEALREASRSANPRTRALAALGRARSSEEAVLRKLSMAFSDPAPEVRLTAVSGLAAVQSPLSSLRREFAPDLARLAKEDPSASVRAAAGAMKGRLP